MIPPWLALSALRRLPWRLIGAGVALVAAAWLIWGQIDAYGDRRAKSAHEAVQALWEADLASRDKATNLAITAAREAESKARKANEVIENEYQEKLVAAAGERDSYFRLLQQARGQVRSLGASQATSSLIAATAGEASIAERIDRATAGLITEARANAEQLDSLIAVVKSQL